MRLAATTAPLLAVLALAGPAHASYGGTPVPASDARPLAWFTTRLGSEVSECSGVLIGRRHVLTAAHCVREPGTGRRRAPAGPLVLGRPGPRATTAGITRVVVHPRYRSSRERDGWDLAILTLDRRVAVRPLRLVGTAEEAGVQPPAKVLAAGYGVTRAGQGIGPRTPRQVRLEVLSPFQCVTPGLVEQFAAVHLCAASTRSGICAGDSGGPLVVRVAGERRVLGITSLAIEQDPCRATVGVFGRVAPALGWIRRQAPGAPVPR